MPAAASGPYVPRTGRVEKVDGHVQVHDIYPIRPCGKSRGHVQVHDIYPIHNI